jgi:Na+-translocating ferredoxin:NAD+ oxidoreductase RnfC subunit
MSSKKRDLESKDINNKKQKLDNTLPDFVSDGLDTKEIRDIVQDIMIIIENNRNKATHEEIINNIKKSDDVKIKLFTERYPMLFDMVTKKEGFDYSSFEYFLTMRDKIIKKELTSDDASKHVGQVWFDKYYKK